MTSSINVLKNIFLIPFSIVLVIIAIPFLLLFALIELPSKKRRMRKLPTILKNDWLSRKKYIYIGLSSNFVLSDFVKEKIISQHGKYIVWDEWNGTTKTWEHSEIDDTKRVITFWQDIGGDFDGDPMIIIATYKPDNFMASTDDNFYQFWLNEDSTVHYQGIKLGIEEAEKKIQHIVTDALDTWMK
jgi:hypothetical protein